MFQALNTLPLVVRKKFFSTPGAALTLSRYFRVFSPYFKHQDKFDEQMDGKFPKMVPKSQAPNSIFRRLK